MKKMGAGEVARLLSEPAGWMSSEGSPENEYVISVRVRVARNLNAEPFPERATAEQRHGVASRVLEAFSGIESAARSVAMSELSPRARAILVEKFLISPAFAARGNGGVLALASGDRSAMINEEDHIRLQCIAGGLALRPAYEAVNGMDDLLERKLDFAFRSGLGYLTACPTNVGTALRAGAMLHLPGLSLVGALERVGAALAGLGMVARGIHGEGSSALGAIFQVSNQVTLGSSEAEILEKVSSVTKSLVAQEREARDTVLRKAHGAIVDRIWRAFGALRYARLMTYGEAIEALSFVRWGSNQGVLPRIPSRTLNELLYRIGPASLGSDGHDLSAVRGTVLRKAFEPY